MPPSHVKPASAGVLSGAYTFGGPSRPLSILLRRLPGVKERDGCRRGTAAGVTGRRRGAAAAGSADPRPCGLGGVASRSGVSTPAGPPHRTPARPLRPHVRATPHEVLSLGQRGEEAGWPSLCPVISRCCLLEAEGSLRREREASAHCDGRHRRVFPRSRQPVSARRPLLG